MRKLLKNSFPTINSTIAYYDPYNFCIFLNRIAKDDLKGILNNPLTRDNIEHIKTITHEARHFADHTGTLWGQKYLLSYLKAMNARIQTRLDRFPLIINYCNQMNQMFYIDYYSEEYNYIPVDRMDKRWRWTPTAGLRFTGKGTLNEEAPIPFVQFATYDHIPLVRVPLSIASLLETNAMNAEFRLQLGFIKSLPEADQVVEGKVFEKEFLINLIYNQDMALYNVAVHLTSNILGLTDIVVAFDISSKVATLALNLPNNLVTKMKVDKAFAIWGEKPNYMLLNNEYGFIFFLLLKNYKEEFVKTKEFSVETLLRSSGLPTYEEVSKIVEGEMAAIRKEAREEENFSDLFIQKLDQGMKLFKVCGLCSEKEAFMKVLTDNNIIPPIFCSDMDVPAKDYHPSEVGKLRPIQKLAVEDWINLSSYLGDKMIGFYEVRGV